MAIAETLAILGGDQRQISMAARLAELGYRVNVWGLGECIDDAGYHVVPNWQDAVLDADAVILPLPTSTDGICVNCPLAREDSYLRFSSLLEAISGKLLLGGRLSEELITRARTMGIKAIDYFDFELLQIKNAVPTAEGAIEIAMHELPVTLDGCACAVIGYGRIGSALAQKLQALGARVTVYARRREVRALAELSHHATMPLSEENDYSELLQLPKHCRAIFNTVPKWIFTRKTLQNVPKNCVLIDLASPPGGIDLAAAHELGLRTVWGTALPGKCAPETAGVILAEAISAII